jgi:hypothetical protein
MLCGLKTILTNMNILNSYRHIRPKKVKYPIPEIPDDSGKKSGTDWVLPKIIGSGRVSGTRQALAPSPGEGTPPLSANQHSRSIIPARETSHHITGSMAIVQLKSSQGHLYSQVIGVDCQPRPHSCIDLNCPCPSPHSPGLSVTRFSS